MLEDEQKAALVVLPFAFTGFVVNWTVAMLIGRLPTLKNSFGRLTASQSVGDAINSTVFSFYYVPMCLFNIEVLKTYSSLCSHLAIIAYNISIYSHLSLSLNRFCSIVLPLHYEFIFSAKNTNKSIFLSWALGILPSFYFYLYRDCRSTYNENIWTFHFAETEDCKNINWYADYLRYNAIVILIVIIDVITVAKVRSYKAKASTIMSTLSSAKHENNELEFLKQACFQAFVFVLELLTYFIISKKFTDKWLTFFLTTVAWVGVHTMDGLITLYFNKEFSRIIFNGRIDNHSNCPMLHFRAPMISFLWNGFHLESDLYKCPEEGVQLLPIATERPYSGLWFLISGILILVVYTPFIIAIATHEFIKTSAYKTMLIVAIFDVLSTFVHSITTGILGILGVTFCDAPRFIFVIGGIGLGSWMACCASSMILAVIRICDINPTYKLGKAFEGPRVYFWLGGSWLYGCLGTFFTQPPLFSPVHMSWFLDPEIGKDPGLYINYLHAFNNFMMVFCTVIFYSFLCYLVLTKARGPVSRSLTFMQHMVILQSFFFCIFHTVAAIIHVYMQFFTAPSYMIIVGQLAWQASTASIVIVHLTLNKTIRLAVKKLVCPKKSNSQVMMMTSASQTRTMF